MLVVEDVPSLQKLLVTMLRKAGHVVTAAGNGQEAVDLAARQPFDIVLMDIQMPEMDGLEATRIVKGASETKDIPLIARTALAMKGDEERIRAAGCDGYVAKPIRYKEFLAIVAAQLAAV